MDLKITVDFPDARRGLGGDGVQFRTAFDGESLHVERIFRRTGLSYARCLELTQAVESFLADLAKRFEVSPVEAELARSSEVHAATVQELARRKADEHLSKK